MEAAVATVSLECFYQECWFFALFMEEKIVSRGEEDTCSGDRIPLN